MQWACSIRNSLNKEHRATEAQSYGKSTLYSVLLFLRVQSQVARSYFFSEALVKICSGMSWSNWMSVMMNSVPSPSLSISL